DSTLPQLVIPTLRVQSPQVLQVLFREKAAFGFTVSMPYIVHKLSQLDRRQHIRPTSNISRPHIAVICDTRLPLFPTLRRYQHHAFGTSRTVNRRRRVFQECNAFHHGSIQVIENTSSYGNPVYNIERFIGCADKSTLLTDRCPPYIQLN